MSTISTAVWAGQSFAFSQDFLALTGWKVLWDANIDRSAAAGYRIGDRFGNAEADLTYVPRATDESRTTRVNVTQTYDLGTDKIIKVSITTSIAVVGYDDMAKPLTGKATADKLYGGKLADLIKGGAGDDIIKGEGHHDRLFGGTGNDKLYGGTGHDAVYGEDGNDVLYGDAGNDILSGGNGNDTLSGSTGIDRLYGGSGTDKLYGQDGNDLLDGGSGNDTLSGGNGNDILRGGSGADVLYGGAGTDVFEFRSASNSTVSATGRDVIKDFQKGDRLDFSYIDANPGKMYDQAFAFLGTAQFTKHAGELRYEKKSGDTFIFADINGDGKADMSIVLDASVTLTKGDFIL